MNEMSLDLNQGHSRSLEAQLLGVIFFYIKLLLEPDVVFDSDSNGRMVAWAFLSDILSSNKS